MPIAFHRKRVGAGLVLAWPAVAFMSVLLPTPTLRADYFNTSLALVLVGCLISLDLK
jgi:hypothetical protein